MISLLSELYFFKMASNLTSHEVLHFLKPTVYDSSLKTRFPCHDMEPRIRLQSYYNKKENKSISSLLIKTTNNDFYMLILFNSYRREADMQENKARPFNSSFCNNFDSEVSVIFSWPSPLPFYSKIVSLETRMRHTIRKWQQFRNRKCEMSNSWRKFFLLPIK